jgi:hypothetical protein
MEKGFCGLARFSSPQNENEKCHVVILVAVDEKKYEYKLSWFGVVQGREKKLISLAELSGGMERR